ncbi:MAG: NAD(P)H-binding protein [Cyclobacteriaceae bacterium]
MLGATGAVGKQVVRTLVKADNIKQLTLLGRREVEDISSDTITIHQHKVDVHTPDSYDEFLSAHDVAICTLGVGQPSKISKEDFIKIDKTAVLDFAKGCKRAGVKHFELLASVGIDAKSNSFYLRIKGELVEALKDLGFDRFSIFQPSMILTPTNRYGFSQGVLLKVWPLLTPLLIGGLKKYRGIKIETLGKSIALNVFTKGSGTQELTWNDFHIICDSLS